VLSEHTAVTDRTCRIADLKVAADKNDFSDSKRPDVISGLFGWTGRKNSQKGPGSMPIAESRFLNRATNYLPTGKLTTYRQ
jgi:hypothetical protein